MNNFYYKHILIVGGLIILLSFFALLINYELYQFPGTSYFPDDFFILVSILGLTYLGIHLLFNKMSRVRCSVTHIIYLFTAMSIIACATNAVQLTPFAPIDHQIIVFEALFNINILSIVNWTANHPLFQDLLTSIYNSLPYQMCLIPLFVILMGRFTLMYDYYFLLLLTCLVGFSFYYFFPTTAPASIIASPLFSAEQTATALKFYQIHNYIKPNTIEGGLIALPSFHCIWALLCTYVLKEWPLLFAFFIIINTLLMASCVLLGWHYLIDVIAAIVLVTLSLYCLNKCKH